MKITLTEHELRLVIAALQSCNTLIATSLAAKLFDQEDPTNDGPEVAILQESWDQ